MILTPAFLNSDSSTLFRKLFDFLFSFFSNNTILFIVEWIYYLLINNISWKICAYVIWKNWIIAEGIKRFSILLPYTETVQIQKLQNGIYRDWPIESTTVIDANMYDGWYEKWIRAYLNVSIKCKSRWIKLHIMYVCIVYKKGRDRRTNWSLLVKLSLKFLIILYYISIQYPS